MTSRARANDPGSINMLRRRLTLAARARETTERRTQELVANVIVSQLLPNSVVKGGTGLKLRLGEKVTRQTPDLDTAFRGDHAEFLTQFRTAATEGWGHFTATIVEGRTRSPKSVPAAYVMQPYTVKLLYRNKPFVTVSVEVGYDELEATNEPADRVESAEVQDLFAELGLPKPEPIPVLPLHHQAAQKIHACSEPGSARSHDLVDLQLIVPQADDALVARTCERLFRFRQQHEWPPVVATSGGWQTRYVEAAADLDVLPDVEEAVSWVNDYIAGLVDRDPTS